MADHRAEQGKDMEKKKIQISSPINLLASGPKLSGGCGLTESTADHGIRQTTPTPFFKFVIGLKIFLLITG